MGRTIICEEFNQSVIDEIYNRKSVQTGLLVGQSTPQKDYVVLMVATPDEGDPKDESDELDEGVKTRSKAKEKVATFETVRESWVTYHAKQVIRMLPGGFDIIGFYAAAPSKDLERHAPDLRKLMFAIHKSLSKSQLAPKLDDACTDRILLQICTLSRKLTCKTIDVSDTQSVLRPADWKFQSAVDKWSILQTRLAIDFPFYIPTGQVLDINRKLQTSLKSIRKLIWNSFGTFNGSVRQDNENLQVSQEGGATRKTRSGKGASHSDQQQKFSVEMFLQPADVSTDDEEGDSGKVEDIGTQLIIRGTIQGEAFVHSKATVKDGLQALKSDILRSLQARCSLLCEDMQESGDGPLTDTYLQTPLRVFANIPSRKFSLCDYLFRDEQATDIIERFQEVLGLSVKEENLNVDKEKLLDEEDLKTGEDGGATSVLEQKTVKTGLPGGAMMGAVLTGAVSALAAAFSYMYLQDS